MSEPQQSQELPVKDGEIVNEAKITAADPEGDGLKNDGLTTTADTKGDILGV